MLDLSQSQHARIAERLRDDITIWLCSTRPDGRPHAVVVWFLLDGDSILIFSKPNNQKLRNIEHNPNVVLALDDTKGGSQPIAIEGTAELVKDGSVATTLPAYAKKYAKNLTQFKWTPESMGQEYSEPIRITLTRVIGG
jgi:PPOX class probable F420-dependent enzyme